MRAASLFVALALAGGCGDNLRGQEDAAPPADASLPTPDAPPSAAGPCLDRPTDLLRPPTALTCDLLPPGFGS
jgi:hypothetical protein